MDTINKDTKFIFNEKLKSRNKCTPTKIHNSLRPNPCKLAMLLSDAMKKKKKKPVAKVLEHSNSTLHSDCATCINIKEGFRNNLELWTWNIHWTLQGLTSLTPNSGNFPRSMDCDKIGLACSPARFHSLKRFFANDRLERYADSSQMKFTELPGLPSRIGHTVYNN